MGEDTNTKPISNPVELKILLKSLIEEMSGVLVTSNEAALLTKILLFIKNERYGDISLAIHTDGKGVKNIHLVEGKKSIYKTT